MLPVTSVTMKDIQDPEERKRAAYNRKHPTPWQRIVRAYKKNRGIRLSADDVCRLNYDDAITTRAMLDDLGQG